MSAKRSAARVEIPTVAGVAIGDDTYVGRINIDGAEYAVLVPPKATGEHAPTVWNDSLKSVKGALSFCDGDANTRAMAKAGSKLGQWALDNGLYIPSLDELDLCYRVLKPGDQRNSLYGRSGINVSAVPPTYPYTSKSPKQTTLKPYRADGAEAFGFDWYWTSTQHAADSDYAWMQYFGYGNQGSNRKSAHYRARAVRRLKI